MLYLNEFHFTSRIDEEKEMEEVMETNFYPFRLLSKRDFFHISFEPITILYGGNGSGKTTALNVIAEAMRLRRETPYNRGMFFDRYVRHCRYEAKKIPAASAIITSDDVFDYMLNLRKINERVDERREELAEEYASKLKPFRLRSMKDYEEFKIRHEARTGSMNQYIRRRLSENVRTQSNGESALFYFSNKIRNDALYLLDEPENSLSPARQIDLAKFLEESARFFNCQFVMATHSPFLLAIRGAKIYDLDADPVSAKTWTQLPNVRAYYDFFRTHADEFASR